MVQFFFTAIQPCPYSPTLTTLRYEKRERERKGKWEDAQNRNTTNNRPKEQMAGTLPSYSKGPNHKGLGLQKWK